MTDQQFEQLLDITVQVAARYCALLQMGYAPNHILTLMNEYTKTPSQQERAKRILDICIEEKKLVDEWKASCP